MIWQHVIDSLQESMDSYERGTAIENLCNALFFRNVGELISDYFLGVSPHDVTLSLLSNVN